MKGQTSSIEEKEFHKFTHEVKNPLAICSGYLEMISREKGSLEEKYLHIIEEELKRSINIINDYSQNKFVNLTIEEFDLTYLLEEVRDLLSSYFIEHDSKILFMEDDEYYIQADYNKLKQVFVNILKNAYEARDNNKLIVVIKIVSFMNYYQIWIIDNGIGMNQKELGKIKNEYYTTKEYGTGLGISYCDEVILKHQGNLFYQSKKNLGTRIIITLPKKKSPKTFSNNNCYSL